MAAIGKDDLVNEEEQEVITDGPGSVPGEVGAPALGSTRAHFHNPPGGFRGDAVGAADEEIGGPFDDGDANGSFEVGVASGDGDCGMAMAEMQVAVDRLAKGQDIIAEKMGLLMLAMQGSTIPPPATPTRTTENPTPNGVAEVPSNAQRQIGHSRPPEFRG